jgi:2-dehydropantoate 2-reductase
MKHAILGAGAVGGLVGAILAHEGEDVTLLVRPESKTPRPGTLSLKTPSDTFETAVRIETKLADDTDVLWIAVKAYQLIGALRSVPSESKIGTIIPLLNGIDHVDLLRARFGHDRVVPATIAVESERIAPGQIVQRSPFARLALSMTGQQRLAVVADRFRRAGFTCEFQADEKTMLWSKLAFLGPFALTVTPATRTSREFLPTRRGVPGSNPPWARPAPSPRRMERLSIAKKLSLRWHHCPQRCAAPCRRMCPLAACRSWTPLGAQSFAPDSVMGSTSR